MRILTSLLLLFVVSTSYGQQLYDAVSAKDSANFEMVKQAIQFLKSRPLPEQIQKNGAGFPSSWNMYDTLIENFYDVGFRKDSIGNFDTSFSQIAFQKLMLYNADVTLDALPIDSLVIKSEPEDLPFPVGSSFSPVTVYTVCYQVGDKLFYTMVLFFSSKNKFLMVSPYIDFEEWNKGIDIEGFYQRHGFDAVRQKLYKFESR